MDFNFPAGLCKKAWQTAKNVLILLTFSILFSSCSFNYVSYGSTLPSKEARKKLYKVNKRKMNAKIYGAQDQHSYCPKASLIRRKVKKPMTSYENN